MGEVNRYLTNYRQTSTVVEMDKQIHTMQFVARHTGLSPHTIRAWERRYAALSPHRTDANRRLYSPQDVEKLLLLQRAMEQGHTIGQIARFSIPDLQQLVGAEPAPSSPAAEEAVSSDHTYLYLSRCWTAVRQMDAPALEDLLTRAAAILGITLLVEGVVVPLVLRIGEGWSSGALTPAHEHMASAVLRTFLGRALATFPAPALAPGVVVTTPAGQSHELGALMAAVTAAAQGWRCLYLGSNLPAAEIAQAAETWGARAVALSIVYPLEDPTLVEELRSLQDRLGPAVALLAGGAGARANRELLDEIGAIHLHTMEELRQELNKLAG